MELRRLDQPFPRLLKEEDLARIHEAALRVLAAHGLRVRSASARRAAARAGLRVEADRVFPTLAQVEDLVARTRAAGGRAAAEPGPPEPLIHLYVPSYPEFVHDLDRDEIVPYTTERLVEMTKLVDALADQRVVGAAPGVALDVPGPLQQLHTYRIAARYARHGRRPVEERHPRAMPYVMEMAEALGWPHRYHDVYVVSPLSLGGDSLTCLETCRDRFERVQVSNMSSVGASAPIGLAHALALGAAEVMAATLVVEALAGLPTDWSVRVCPFNPRAMAISLGSPEEFLFQRASTELTAWYHGRPPGPPAGMMHTQAKLPDAQAQIERASQMMLCTLFGARGISGAGALSLDEVFSAEQLVLDCELRDHTERLLRGADLSCDSETLLAEVSEGLESGFLGLETTAARYPEVYWLPRLFERRSCSAWLQAGASKLSDRARERVRALIAAHDYQLDPAVAAELDRIFARAERELLS